MCALRLWIQCIERSGAQELQFCDRIQAYPMGQGEAGRAEP